jgi:hypothetical protein
MNASSKIQAGRFALDKPLLTLGQVEEWQERLRSLKAQRDVLDREIDGLEKRLAGAALFIADAQAEAVEEAASCAIELPLVAKPERLTLKAEFLSPKSPNYFVPSNSGPSAFKVMSDIALKLAAEHPEGFEARQIWRAIENDASVSPKVKSVNWNYVYTVLKRLVGERVLARVQGAKYVLYERVADLAGSGPITADQTPDGKFAGFKVVPMSKEERIRIEAANYLRRRANRTAHRAQIAEHLIANDIMGREKSSIKTLAVYFARWSEFVADGEGNYQLREAEKTNGDS